MFVIERDFDLTRFPVPTYSPKDGGPYITLPMVITRDPDHATGSVAVGKNGHYAVEANNVIAQSATAVGIDRTIDDVFVPALRRTRLERQRDSISSDEEQFIYTAMSDSLRRAVRV